MRRRYATAIGLVVAAFALVLSAAPADAAGIDISYWHGVESRCANSPYTMCLYYNANYGVAPLSAWWGTNVPIANLTGHTFFANSGTGAGTPTRNNSHGMSCDSLLPCYSYVYPTFSGNWDMLLPGWSGTLYYTLNNNASIRTI